MKTSAEVLEFEALRQLVGRYDREPAGQARAGETAAAHRSGRARRTTWPKRAKPSNICAPRPVRKPAARGGAPSGSISAALPDLDAAVHKLRIEGAGLEPKEIFDLFTLLDRGRRCQVVLDRGRGALSAAGRRAPTIGDFRGCCSDLDGKILPDGSVADHASVALGRLRRDIERQKKSIQDSLERFLKAHREEGVLQEEFVTIRNERFVVPVIAGQRRKLDGVIHGASSSGHTLFVEPLETIDLNNELVRLTEEEMREVHRILREMTDRLRGSRAIPSGRLWSPWRSWN